MVAQMAKIQMKRHEMPSLVNHNVVRHSFSVDAVHPWQRSSFRSSLLAVTANTFFCASVALPKKQGMQITKTLSIKAQ